MTNIMLLSLMMVTLMYPLMQEHNTTAITIPITTNNNMNMSLELIMSSQTCMFSITVTIISLITLIYSKEYIQKEMMNRFYSITTIFVISMIMLIHSNNMFTLIMGWDGLGLSSYLLVIFYQNHKSSSSGFITLYTNRLGDITLIMSIAMSVNLYYCNIYNNPFIQIITLILMMMAMSTKSAQLPFSAWLPAAMAAPTPISALVHSSTLVTAGLFLMMMMAHPQHPFMSKYMMVITTTTMMMASVTANIEQDSKKVIAYSTLSQIAMMMFSISVNAPQIAYFHMINHAFFKSTMFLTMGFMIHSTSYQDTRHINNMQTTSPVIATIFTITSLALMGLPFMSGFYSKDLLIELTETSETNKMLVTMMIMSIGLTASYSSRLMMLSSQNHSLIKSDLMIHKYNYMKNCTILMAPLAITSGAIMMWKLNPMYSPPIEHSLKMKILSMIIMGVISGSMLQKMKTSSIKPFISQMMMLHQLTSYMMMAPLTKTKTLTTSDSHWTEATFVNMNFKTAQMNSRTSVKTKMILPSISIMLMITLIMIQT